MSKPKTTKANELDAADVVTAELVRGPVSLPLRDRFAIAIASNIDIESYRTRDGRGNTLDLGKEWAATARKIYDLADALTAASEE